MSTLNPLIRRDSIRFDPLYGDTRHRVPPRTRRPRLRAVVSDEESAAQTRYLSQFITAFIGGLVFFSILIF